MKKTVKRSIYILLSVMFCLALLSPLASAATDSSRSYNFQLTVNGGTVATVSEGEEITLEVLLERTDGGKTGSYAMYSMQDEIIFNGYHFSLVESSKRVADGYDFNVRTLEDGIRQRVILSRMTLKDEGVETPDSMVIATFNLKTLQPVQGAAIISNAYKVNSKIGDTYITTANDVTVTVSGTGPVAYAVTFKGGVGATGTPPSIGSKASGESFTLPANTFTRDGYTFAGWNDGTNTYAAGSTYTMPAHTVTFTVQWTKSTGGGGGGGGGAPPEEPKDETEIIDLPVVIEGSTATLVIEEQELSNLLAGKAAAGPVTMDFSTEKISSLNIPATALKTVNQAAQTGAKPVEGLRVALPKGSIEFDATALNALAKTADEGNLTISINDAANTLTDEQKAVVKDNPVYDIRVETDTGKAVDLKGTITVYLPYELKAGQVSAGVVVYYVDSNGSIVNMKAEYDPVKKMAYFTTDHLSIYMVDYDESLVQISPMDRYVDVDPSAWYYEAVQFAIERGLFVGTSETTFEPNTAMSRAMLVTVLWRLEDSPAATSASTFKDVAIDAWYANAVAWANANEIVSGYGGGLFGPNDNITREQMAVILRRYAEFKGYNVTATDNLTLFTDAQDVSDWALTGMKWAVAEKLISGMTTTTLVPQGNATRAQVASILMRYIVNIVE